jgi:hypothetical protein
LVVRFRRLASNSSAWWILVRFSLWGTWRSPTSAPRGDWLRNTLTTQAPTVPNTAPTARNSPRIFQESGLSSALSGTTSDLGASWVTFARKDSKLANGKGMIALAIWPWYAGSYLAVHFGAANPSLGRTITGWVFEAPWLAFLAFLCYSLATKRSAPGKRALPEETEAHEKGKAARCWVCQHVQTVPVGQKTFTCEQCMESQAP